MKRNVFIALLTACACIAAGSCSAGQAIKPMGRTAGADGNELSSEVSESESLSAKEAYAELESTAEDKDIPEYARDVIADENSVKLLGRTCLIGDTRWCAYPGTGIEFEYTGKRLEITLQGDDSIYDSSNRFARVAVYADGKRVADELMDSVEKTIKAFESKETETVRIKVIKLSESEMSTVGIKPVHLEAGEEISPAPQRTHTIEFVGDSLTCGYGVDDEDPEHHFSSSTEDVTKTYASKAAALLDADYSIAAISGYGVISGYTGDPSVKNERPVMPAYYETLGYSDYSFGGGDYPQDVSWDHESFVPEVIIINLGTNDATYCQNDKAKLEEFVKGYKDFLAVIRKDNPDAEIFCILGTMSSHIWEQVDLAAREFSEENKDDKVHSLLIDVKDGELGYAADWHPTEATHQVMAEALYEKIMDVMRW